MARLPSSVLLLASTLSLCLADTVVSDTITAPAPKTLYSPAPASSYGAPAYKPSYKPSYNAPTQTVQTVELPPYDYYHAGPPRVYKVHVPVTQRPYTVHVPQNVPVNFVPVSVPTQNLGPISIVEQNPFTFTDYDDPYVKRKELVKGALLLGTGVLKGALLTTLYNNLNNNNRNIVLRSGE